MLVAFRVALSSSPVACWTAADEEDAAWQDYHEHRARVGRLTLHLPPVHAERKWVEKQLTWWRGVTRRSGQPVDERPAEWNRGHYALLYELDKTAYLGSLWWQTVRAQQRQHFRTCERCGAVSALHAHHLHYLSVGAERIGIDLMTLCESCHLAGQHEYLKT